jgi:pilus assembly protein CpaF
MQKLPHVLHAPQVKSYEERAQMLPPALVAILEEVLKEVGLASGTDEAHEVSSDAGIAWVLRQVSERLGFELSPYEQTALLAYIEAEQKPFGILQPLIDDPGVTDIIVTHYAKVAVQKGRRTYSTGIQFGSVATYEGYVERILSKAQTTYSTKKPIADGMIGDSYRIHAVHACICESGPYLTIRINRYGSVSVENLQETGIAPQPIFEYLSKLVSTGHTIFVVGEVGTGKTTLVRALAARIPTEESILVIEDTPEIRLAHPQVRYLSTRETNVEGVGRVSPGELIRGGMRMAMNRIIFGEIRDAEAAESFVDVCASGHPGLSTIHARSGLEALTRLELFLGRAQRGVERAVINEQIATSVHVVVFLGICHVTKLRRIMEVIEVGPAAEGVIRHREIFRYRARAGRASWQVVTKVSGYRELLESGAEGGTGGSPVMLSAYPQDLFEESVVTHERGSGTSHHTSTRGAREGLWG